MIIRSPPSSPAELPVFIEWERFNQAENQSDCEEDSSSYSTNAGREVELTGIAGATDPVLVPMEERVNRVRALLAQEPVTPRRVYQIRDELNWNYAKTSLSVVKRVLESNLQIFQGCWKDGPRKVLWTLHPPSSDMKKEVMTTEQRVELIKSYLASHPTGVCSINQIRDGLGWAPTETTRDFVRKALLRRPNIFRRASHGYRDTWALQAPPKPRLSAKSEAKQKEPSAGSRLPLPQPSITGKRTRNATVAEWDAPAVKRRATSVPKRTPVNEMTLTFPQGNGQLTERDIQLPPPMTSQIEHEQSSEAPSYHPPESWLPVLSPLDPLDLRPVEDDLYGLSYRADAVLSEMQSLLFLDREVFVATLSELNE